MEMNETEHPVLANYRNSLAVHVMWFTDKRNGGITESSFREVAKVIRIFERNFDKVMEGMNND